ncbi:hypothetical protein B0H63DRAFT_450117 [Podospora didyma]|uniref:Uncharacterized protein n=1 Tax=Podospora didyma TaxID=330526 RepID=A0AAE0NR56_9PEZI|nr:hypothetical protein B0H63DRAFT_450117 [Podospora didyma]
MAQKIGSKSKFAPKPAQANRNQTPNPTSEPKAAEPGNVPPPTKVKVNQPIQPKVPVPKGKRSSPKGTKASNSAEETKETSSPTKPATEAAAASTPATMGSPSGSNASTGIDQLVAGVSKLQLALTGLKKKNRGHISAAPEDAAKNEQLGRLVLLVQCMQSAGLCSPDIQFCLVRYIQALSTTEFWVLKLHLTQISTIKSSPVTNEWDTVSSALNTISKLGHNLPLKYIKQAAANVISKLDKNPETFDGPNGWFLWLASGIAKRATFVKDEANESTVDPTPAEQAAAAAAAKKAPAPTAPANRGGRVTEDLFWLPELENAMFLAMMVRFRVKNLLWDGTNTRQPIPFSFSPMLVAIEREAWCSLFRFFSDNAHFNHRCKCADKTLVLKTMAAYRGTVSQDPKDAAQVAHMEGFLTQTTQLGIDDPKSLYGEHYTANPRRVSKEVFYNLHWNNDEFFEHFQHLMEILEAKKNRRYS